jgi:hypothetical protein
MITHNGTYLLHATHHGMPIVAATMGGKIVFGSKWLLLLTQQAIVAAFGAEGTEVIRKTNDYLNRIATTDPQRALQLAGFINEDPMLVCSLVETSKVRYAIGGVSCQFSTGIVPTDTMQINSMFRMNEMTQYSPVYQQGYVNENGNWTRFAVRNGKNNEVIFNLNNFTTTLITFESSIIGKWLDTEMTQQGIVVNGTDYPSKGISKGNNNNNPIWLFGRGDTYGMENIDIAFFETIDGEQRHNLVPFVRQGANYFLDTETCELTAGAFTIAITDKA